MSAWWCERGLQYALIEAPNPHSAQARFVSEIERCSYFRALDCIRGIGAGNGEARQREFDRIRAVAAETTVREATEDDLAAWAEIQRQMVEGPVELSPEQVMRASGADGLFG